LTINFTSARFRKRVINWNGNNWAFAYDFYGNDISSAQVRGEDCSGTCAQTSGCTHFTWTTWNGGTCWMKGGAVSKDQATESNDRNSVCGVLDNPQSSGGGGQTLSGVLATRHAAYEAGACSLPQQSYAVTNPVALGNIDSLGYLKFQPELCGQVLQVDCGNGPLNIIVSNSNLGGGLDLYAGLPSDKVSNGVQKVPNGVHVRYKIFLNGVHLWGT
jgi:hypothetical protein